MNDNHRDEAPPESLDGLKARLAEAEETLRAIRHGEVDAVVVSGPRGDQIYSLVGAESVYRIIVDTMNEAAFTVSFDGTILYSNAQFGDLLKQPLEKIVGGHLQEFVAAEEQGAVEAFLAEGRLQPVRRRMVFAASDGSSAPAHIVSNVLDVADGPSICVVATDLTGLENPTELIARLREQQKALAESDARLRQANAALAQQVAAVEGANAGARASGATAVKLMEEAVAARRKADEVNNELLREIARRRRLESRISADLAALRQMHELSEKVLETEEFQPLLQEIMDAAVAIMRAERGTLQLLESKGLRIVAHHGQQAPFLEYFATTENRASASGLAAARGERVIVPDVERSALFARTTSLPVLRAAGVRAVQSTPILSRAGALLGVLSTQWGVPHTPDAHDLWRLDLLARQAGDVIEHVKSEEQLRTTLESIGDGFLALDAEWRFIYVNAPAERMLNIRRGDALGKIYWDLFPSVAGSLVEQEYRRAATGETRIFENYSEHVGRWFHARCFPRQGGGISVYFQDISERKRAEEKLRASEERFRVLSEAMPQIVWSADAKGEVDYFNQQALHYSGSPSEDVSGSKWEASVHPDDVAPTAAGWRRALRTGRAGQLEYRLRRADGEYRWHLSRAVPVCNEKGEVVRWIGTATDIHEQKTAEQTLEQRVTERTAELARVNRTLRTLSDVNQAVLHARTEMELLEEVCRILVEVGGYRFAWVGRPEQDEAKSVRPVARAGIENGYLDAVKITWADEPWGRGPTGTAIRLGQITVNRNTESEAIITPWREELVKRGYACSIGLPLQAGSQTLGALTLYAAEPEAFDDQEIKLLSELAADLGFGMDVIRTREERQRVADSLRESEALARARADELAALMEADPGIEFIALDPECREMTTNPVGLRLLGLPVGANVSLSAPQGGRLPFRALNDGRELAPEDLPVQRAAFTGKPVKDFELTLAFNDGRTRELLGDAVPLFDAEGKVRGAVGSFVDITERKRSEEAMLRASVEIRDLYNNAPCGYDSLDANGVVVRINDTELRWLGYSREEVIGKLNIVDLFSEKSKLPFEETFAEFKRTGVLHDLEIELVRKDGSVFPALVNATAVRDQDGNFVMSRSTLIDITVRKRAQAAAAAERQRLYHVLETLPGNDLPADARLSHRLCQPQLPRKVRRIPGKTLL